MTYVDLNLRLPELLLMRVDKMSMGVALEGRVPFLDHRFVGLALSIPERAKVDGGELKHILKRAVRGLIPDEVIDRPKQGFARAGAGVAPGGARADRAERGRGASAARPASSTAARRGGSSTRRAPQSWNLLNLALWHKEFIA